MGGFELLVVLWKEWRIQAMVLVSFIVQLTLHVLADFRRRYGWFVLKAIIWSAYTLADLTAVYALGHMSVVGTPSEHHLMALWAPLLLVHLGGQDTITAYALEDNRLWLRHLQTFGVQSMAAAYVIHTSSVLSRPSLIGLATILMCVVGVLKYGERVCALKHANSYASTTLSSVTRYKDINDERAPSLPVASAYSTRRNREGLQLIAYKLLFNSKLMFKGGEGVVLCDKVHCFRLKGEEMVQVVLIQLSMMYDLLYTKAAIVHTWYGCCIRVFSLPATVLALLLFHASTSTDKADGYNKKDVNGTYLLLGGAVVLEVTSVVRAMCSRWTCALLLKWEWERLARLTSLPMRIIGMRTSYAMGDMGQLSLSRLCGGSRNNTTSSKIARWVGLDDWWDCMFYSWSIPVSKDIPELVIKISRKHGHFYYEYHETRGQAFQRSIRECLDVKPGPEKWLDDHELELSMTLELDETILLWHIATHLYTSWLREQEWYEQDLSNFPFPRVAEEVSNYMLFLLASRSYILPGSVSRRKYVQLCYDLITSREDLLGSIHDQVRAWMTNATQRQGGFEINYPSGSKWNDTLNRASRLAVLLISRGNDSLDRYHMMQNICFVWVEMLSYAACCCNKNFLAKHLTDGGELLGIVAHLKFCVVGGLFNEEDMTLPQGTNPPAGTHTTDDKNV